MAIGRGIWRRDLEGDYGWTHALWTLITLGGALLSLIPLYWLVRTSFLDLAHFYRVPLVLVPPALDVSNYIEVFAQTNFTRYYINTLVIAFFGTLNTLVVNTCAGYAFARLKFPGRDYIFYAYLATMMIPSEVTIVPAFLVVRALGFYDTYLGMILPGAASAFTIFMLRQFFLSIPREIEEAAEVEGCSKLGVLWHIDLPLSQPILVVLIIGSVHASFESFLWPLIITRTDAIRPIGVAISYLSAGFEGTQNPGALEAALVMMIIPSILLALYVQKYIVQGFARALIIG